MVEICDLYVLDLLVWVPCLAVCHHSVMYVKLILCNLFGSRSMTYFGVGLEHFWICAEELLMKYF